MRALFLLPPASDRDFQRAVLGSYHLFTDHSLVLVDRMNELIATHEMISRPTPAEVGWIMDHVWLSPDFYRECGRRLDAAVRRGRRDTRVIAARRLVDLGMDMAAGLRARLNQVPRDDERSSSLLESMAIVNRLSSIIDVAYPCPSRPWVDPERGFSGVSIGESVAAADDIWAAAEPVVPPRFLDSIVASAPDVIFFQGMIPGMLPRSIAMALKLRPLLPGIPFIAWHTYRDLFSSFASVREEAVSDGALFEIFDAVSVYPDLEDKTFCDVMNRLAAGRSLEGIQNLAVQRCGSVEFRAPDPGTLSRYLDQIRLGITNPVAHATQTAHPNPWHERRLTIHKITPVKQVCYWDRCHFCATSSQSFVKMDPHVGSRGVEAARELIRLRDEGASLSLVGHDVVPPSVLRQIVECLEREAVPPRWFFEGKADSVFSPDFILSLRAAGCCGVIMGLECASDRVHAAIDKHVPGIDLREIERMLTGFDEAGMAVHVNTIYNLPGTTATDFEQYREWLRANFHRRRLFTFNTNEFQLLPGSRMARTPAQYGLRLRDVTGSGRLFDRLPFDYISDASRLRLDPRKIWRCVFGASRYRGMDMAAVQMMYAELSASLFLDAVRERNLFKDIAGKLYRLHQIGSAQVAIRDGVESVAVSSRRRGEAGGADLESKDPQSSPVTRVLIIDTKRNGTWSRLPHEIWRVIEASSTEGLTVDQAAAKITGSGACLESLHEIVADLVADELLTPSWRRRRTGQE